MRVYHILPTEYAIDDLIKRRLKVSQFIDLNDPFELLSVELSDKVNRKKFGVWKKTITREYGVLCFSRNWNNPVLWSHYGDKHKGICLGFDVPDRLLKEVAYTGNRMVLWVEGELQKGKLHKEIEDRLLCTKFEHWRYENEVRVILPLKKAYTEEGLYFVAFDKNLELKEVIAGPRCSITKTKLKESIGTINRAVKITKARLAFKSFKVVENKLG